MSKKKNFTARKVFIWYMVSKLDSKGNFNYFPGNTIICKILEPIHNDLYTVLSEALEILKTSELSQFFSFLPLESLHITIYDLLTQFYIKSPIDLIDSGLSPPQIEHDLIRRLLPIFENELDKPSYFSFRWKETCIDNKYQTARIDLEPLEKEKLSKWRKNVFDHTNVQYHENKVYHITLAYKISPLSVDEKEILKIKESIDMLFNKNGKALEMNVGPPKLTFFEDMTEFKEIPLYTHNYLAFPSIFKVSTKKVNLKEL